MSSLSRQQEITTFTSIKIKILETEVAADSGNVVLELDTVHRCSNNSIESNIVSEKVDIASYQEEFCSQRNLTSLMQIIKRSGPSTDPCGTPDST